MKNYINILNARFNRELQQQIDGTLPKGHVYKLGKAGKTLRCAGVDNLPIEMSAERLIFRASADLGHPFDLSNVKNLPKAINYPIAIFDSTKRDGSKIILTELQHRENNFIVVMRVQHKGRGRIEINDIRSIYPKDNVQGIINWINSKDKLLRWVDKKKP
ncbi:MAG: hypothetical protein FWE63_03085 [Bacteroidales bacterium]|nr:hypothetical protein [Bacteroidales bacterium]